MSILNALTQNGYKEFSGHRFRNEDHFFQRVVWNPEGTKKRYFINAYVYDFRKLGQNRVEAVLEAVLYLRNGEHFTLTSSGFLDEQGLREAESLICNAYRSMECVPDVNNN